MNTEFEENLNYLFRSRRFITIIFRKKTTNKLLNLLGIKNLVTKKRGSVKGLLSEDGTGRIIAFQLGSHDIRVEDVVSCKEHSAFFSNTAEASSKNIRPNDSNTKEAQLNDATTKDTPLNDSNTKEAQLNDVTTEDKPRKDTKTENMHAEGE